MKTILDYADLVKEQHALNTTIAPVETDLTSASKAYAVGQKFVYDGVLYQAKTAIAQGAALVLNTNYEAADDVSTEIEALTNQVTDISDEVTDMNNVLGAKNLLPNNVESRTLNGVTFTVNNDGSITINGTATNTTFFYLVGDSITESGYKLSGSFIVSTQNYISQDSYLRIGKTSGDYTNVREETVVSFSENSDIYVVIRIASGEVIDNVTLYPMIRLASIEDSTYVPYAKTNQELTAENQTLTNQANDMVNMLGSKNLNGTTYQTKTGSGLTWTVNSDGSISLSGTSTGEITNGSDNSFVAPITAQVILSGGISDDAHIFPWDVTDNARPYSDSSKTTRATGNVSATNELSFYMEKGHLYRMTLRCNQDSTVNGTFYPMLRLASIIDNTYVPYAMTNRELTDNVQFYNANTDGTVKQNHYAVAKGIGETLVLGGMVTKLVRFSGNYTDFMIISKNDSGYIYCIDFMSNSGFGKIMSFRYNPGTDVFTDEFIIT